MINILMIGKPGGNLVRTYEWHIEALNSDKENRFNVSCIHELIEQKENIDVSKYDIFWFYAKAFHPSLYYQIKNARPEAKIICGPNVMLDKPDIGPSDDWDNWYVNECRPDIHLDQVQFYSDHVKKFLSQETRAVAKVLDKCIKIDNEFYDSDCEKEFDCLLYSKKRRYDYNFEQFRLNLIDLLEEEGISYCEVAAGKFGTYKREDYFNLLNKSSVMVNLSLDECPGILNYESMFFNVPVIGSPHNTPNTSSPDLHVKDTDVMTEKYLVRSPESAEAYFLKIKDFLKQKNVQDISHREWILSHTSFERYCNNVAKLVEEL